MINLNKAMLAGWMVVGSLLFSIPSFAATTSEIKSQINKIKLDENYFFGEHFDESEEIADIRALQELLATVNSYRVQNDSQPPLSLDELKKEVKTLNYFDENIYWAFYYIPLSKVLGKNNNITSMPDKVQEQFPAQNNNSQQSIPEKENISDATTLTNGNVTIHIASDEEIGEMVEAILAQSTWYEIRSVLSHYKALGRIRESGKDESLTSVPSDATILLFDDKGDMTGFYSPQNQYSQRTNYRKRNLESETEITDYKFIFWYK